MKNSINRKKLCLATTSIIGFLAASVHAQTIGWNFDGWGDISGPSQQAGVVLAPY